MELPNFCELKNVELPLGSDVIGIGLYDATYFYVILYVIQIFKFV